MAKASNAEQRTFINKADDHQKAIIKTLQGLSRTHGLDRTWSDWVEMGALAMANAVDRTQFDRREKRYLEIVQHYAKDEVKDLAEAFAHLVQCWDQRVALGEFGDVLGSTFMMLNMGNADTGQFFTPYELSRSMSGLIMGDEAELAEKLKDRGFLQLFEPACGAGGMLIAAVHALQDAQINYQQAMHVTAIDVDRRCVHMTYLQLALLHIPAVVVHGNALTGEEWDHWYTPAHILGGWGARLRRGQAVDAMRQLLTAETSPDAAASNDASLTPVQTVTTGVISQAVQRAGAAGQMALF